MICRDAARRAGLSATAELQLLVVINLTAVDFKLTFNTITYGDSDYI